ncbi:hypothetical protein IGI95_001903 [Enterococcus sp. DIV0784]|uniref:hypothetical protein n=1 Tax=unclassified Enterococcus TaxID=2608891 RepID=UPI003F261502
MLNKKMLVSSAMLGVFSLGFAGQVLAAEGDMQTVNGSEGKSTTADVITRGILGDTDSTNPDTPLPEGDDRWVKVTLPTAVVFESDKDKATISSPKNYKIENESGRPVKVDVSTYEITGGNGVAALSTLNIKPSIGYAGSPTIALVKNGAAKQKYTINTELVRLANNKGDYKEVKGTGYKSTRFEFTGTMDKSKLAKDQNFVESKLTFKFTPLRMDGKTTEEANK